MNPSSSLQYGVQTTLIPEIALQTSSIEKSLTLQSSACIIGIRIPAQTGDVVLDVYSEAGEGEVLKTSQVFTTTTDLTQIRVNDVMGVLRVQVTSVADATVEVKVKAAHSTSDTSIDMEINESALVVQNPTILNVTMGASGAESTLNFPANTKKYKVKARGNSRLQFSYVSGQSGTTYWTEWPGFTLDEEDIDRASTTLYAQSSKNGEVLEIKLWT